MIGSQVLTQAAFQVRNAPPGRHKHRQDLCHRAHSSQLIKKQGDFTLRHKASGEAPGGRRGSTDFLCLRITWGGKIPIDSKREVSEFNTSTSISERQQICLLYIFFYVCQTSQAINHRNRHRVSWTQIHNVSAPSHQQQDTKYATATARTLAATNDYFNNQLIC